MSRLVSINGTLIDLEYIYKITIDPPTLQEYNNFIRDSHLICSKESELSKFYRFLPQHLQRLTTSNLIHSTYVVNLYTFNLDKPQTFYFAHINEYNKFINLYKEHKKVSKILEI